MANPEILLLAGAPGSGKSSIAKRAVELDRPEGVRHLSIGDLKRSIEAGETPSAYAELLKQRAHPDRKTGAAPSEAMTGMMEEFIMARPDGLTIVDGFPRYLDRVAPFKESMQRIGAKVLGIVTVEFVPKVVLVERMSSRSERPGQKIKDPLERLADHWDNILPTINLLSECYPLVPLDGMMPIDANADSLAEIYSRLSGTTSGAS